MANLIVVVLLVVLIISSSIQLLFSGFLFNHSQYICAELNNYNVSIILILFSLFIMTLHLLEFFSVLLYPKKAISTIYSTIFSGLMICTVILLVIFWSNHSKMNDIYKKCGRLDPLKIDKAVLVGAWTDVKYMKYCCTLQDQEKLGTQMTSQAGTDNHQPSGGAASSIDGPSVQQLTDASARTEINNLVQTMLHQDGSHLQQLQTHLQGRLADQSASLGQKITELALSQPIANYRMNSQSPQVADSVSDTSSSQNINLRQTRSVKEDLSKVSYGKLIANKNVVHSNKIDTRTADITSSLGKGSVASASTIACCPDSNVACRDQNNQQSIIAETCSNSVLKLINTLMATNVVLMAVSVFGSIPVILFLFC